MLTAAVVTQQMMSDHGKQVRRCTESDDDEHDVIINHNNNNDHNNETNYLLQQRRSSYRLARRPTFQHPISEPVNTVSLMCGLLAGIAQAGLFNPYDRALYLSVKDNRPFLHRQNWQNPYTGFAQSIGGRALQGGLYFPVEHFFLRSMNNNFEIESDPKLNFLAGTAAGAFNATVLNPISAIKYKTWGRDVNRGMVYEIVGMFHKAKSLRPFYNGLLPTVARDVVFGGTYTWLRLQIPLWCNLPSNQHWVGNFVAAALATVLSGPFNFVRNIQFATPSNEKAASMYRILHELAKETRTQGTAMQRVLFVQNKLRIGWGTARVAMGMTFAHAVYDWLHGNLKPPLHRW